VRGLTPIDNLERKKIACQRQCATKNFCHLALNLHPLSSTHLVPCFSTVHSVHGTIFIPVWTKFMISSGGLSSITTVETNSCRKFASKLATVYLLVAVVAFLWTNPMQSRSKQAQCLLSNTGPPYSAGLFDHTLEEYL